MRIRIVYWCNPKNDNIEALTKRWFAVLGSHARFEIPITDSLVGGDVAWEARGTAVDPRIPHILT